MNRSDLIFTAVLTVANVSVLACALWRRRRQSESRPIASVLDRIHNP